MMTIEEINKIYISIDAVTYLEHWFNDMIREYGKVTVNDLLNQLLMFRRKPEDVQFIEYKYGWTDRIDPNKHMILRYPDCRLKLPNYKVLD